jgi:hypothetical protein
MLTQPQLRDYLDIEATVNDEEEEEESGDEELGESTLRSGTMPHTNRHVGNFFNDVDEETNDWTSRLTSPAPTDFTQEVLEIRNHLSRGTSAHVYNDEDILGLQLVPRVSDPHMWSVRVKVSPSVLLLYEI